MSNNSVTTSIREQRGKMLKSRMSKLEKDLENISNDSNMAEGIREMYLYHGLKLASSTALIDRFADICYCSETKEYLVLDTGAMIHRYSMQGKPIRPPYQLSSTMLFTRMLWCNVARVTACYIPHDDMIWIINSSCKLLQIVRNEFRIESLFYSSNNNEIIVVGTNKITTYPMHDIEHPLNSLHTLTYLDNSYGALWRIEYSSLIERSSVLTIAGSYLTTIYIMSLNFERDTELSSEFMAKKLAATKSPITALYYHRTSEWLITGDQQGNVSGWNLKLECVMSCANGHESQIRLIIGHPAICGFLTTSNDKVLQVWSCNLRDKIELFRDIGEIWRIAINESAASLACLGKKLNCFNMHQLYVFYAPLTASSTNLYSTRNPNFPTRIIVTCFDNTVRILSGMNGRQINVQILSPKLEVIAASYSGITNRMYTIILKTGEILVSSVKTKPMKLKHVWVNDERTITCIVAYEIFDEIRSIDDSKKITINPVTTLIIAGTLDGKIVIIEETSGKHSSVVSAHDGEIVDICASTISRQIVSVGNERCVKIWRIFHDIASPLILMGSVNYVITINRVASLGFTVCMASSHERSKDHRIIMYDTSERIRLDHHPSKEHSALITSIATLETLEICASSSLDKTIRVWNKQNELLKILDLNTSARNIIFSSLRGDIVFGAGKHLYKIPCENYLSPSYRARLIAEEISDEFENVVIKESSNYRIYENEVEREKILHPVSSTPFGSLDTESSDSPKLELMLLEQIALNRRYRDEDILRIKEGQIKAVRLVGDKSMMSREAWEKQMLELLGSTIDTKNEVVPEYNFFKKSEDYSSVKKVYNEPEIFRMIHGYSIPSLDNYTEDLRDTVKFPKLPRSRFLPNSLIYKIHEETPRKKESSVTPIEKEKFKYQYPPEILSGDLRDDSQDESKIHLTLSQLVDLGTGEEELKDL